jgi:hypothetical protein
MRTDHAQHLGGKASRDAHLFYFIGGFQGNGHARARNNIV